MVVVFVFVVAGAGAGVVVVVVLVGATYVGVRSDKDGRFIVVSFGVASSVSVMVGDVVVVVVVVVVGGGAVRGIAGLVLMDAGAGAVVVVVAGATSVSSTVASTA